MNSSVDGKKAAVIGKDLTKLINRARSVYRVRLKDTSAGCCKVQPIRIDVNSITFRQRFLKVRLLEN